MKLNNFIRLFIMVIVIIIIILLLIQLPWKKIIRYGERNLVSGNR